MQQTKKFKMADAISPYLAVSCGLIIHRVNTYVVCHLICCPKSVNKGDDLTFVLQHAVYGWNPQCIWKIPWSVLYHRSEPEVTQNTDNKLPYLDGRNATRGWWWLSISYINLIHIVCLDLLHRSYTNIDTPGERGFHQQCTEYTSMVSIGFDKMKW